MDRVVIGKESDLDITINKDSHIIVKDEVQSKKIKFNILDCKVTIVDMGNIVSKSYNFKNSEVTLIEIINKLNIWHRI